MMYYTIIFRTINLRPITWPPDCLAVWKPALPVGATQAFWS